MTSGRNTDGDISQNKLAIKVTQKSNSKAIEASILINDFVQRQMTGRESPSHSAYDPGSALLEESNSPSPDLSPKFRKKQQFLAQMSYNLR